MNCTWLIWENNNMARMKYVVLEIDGEQMPIIFPDSPKLSHKAVWRGIQQGLRMQARESGGGSWAADPVSMGFVHGISAISVEGYSESARYGFDAVPRELWHATEAHPETDLPLINGGKSLVTIAKDQREHHRINATKLLKGECDETRHMNSNQKRRRFEEYVSIHLSADCNEHGGYSSYIPMLRERYVL